MFSGDDEFYEEVVGRLEAMPIDALGEQWHELKQYARVHCAGTTRCVGLSHVSGRAKFVFEAGDALSRAGSVDFEVAADRASLAHASGPAFARRCDLVRHLTVRGTHLTWIGATLQKVRALVLDPGDDLHGSTSSFDLMPLRAYGSRLHHLELNLSSLSRGCTTTLGTTLAVLVGLRRLRVWGQRDIRLRQVRSIERMGMLEDVSIEADGSWIDDDPLEEPTEGRVLDLSCLLRLRSLRLDLPEVGLRSAFDEPNYEELGSVQLGTANGLPRQGKTWASISGWLALKPASWLPSWPTSWLVLKPAPTLSIVRLATITCSVSAGDSAGWQGRWHRSDALTGYTRQLHDELVAVGATVHPTQRNQKPEGPFRSTRGYARNVHACAWWVSQACERLVGTTLPELCIDTIRHGCRLTTEASELEEEVEEVEGEVLCQVAATLGDNQTRGIARLSSSSLEWVDPADPSSNDTLHLPLSQVAVYQQSKAGASTAKLRVMTKDGKTHTLDMTDPAAMARSFESRDMLRDVLHRQLAVLNARQMCVERLSARDI